MKRSILLLSATLIAAPIAAQPSAPPFLIQETGETFWKLDEAVRAIGETNATLMISPGIYRQCAVQLGGRIAYKAIQLGTVVFDSETCEGKAALVLRGKAASIDGIIFQNMRVPDGNGAGIRLEKGDLYITRSMFRNSEEGILTGDDGTAEITIDRSTFSGLGRCDRGLSCAHSIYVGAYGSLSVTNTRFERGRGGHYVKSRSGQNTVSDSSFDDTQGSTTNYMIDLPAGSVGNITRNIFVQGKDKENYSALIAIAAEARTNTSAGLVVSNNKATIAPGIDRETTFVANWSRDPIRIVSNLLGAGIKTSDVR